MSDHDEEASAETVRGDVPEGLGPEVFRERLNRLRRDGAEHGARVRLGDEDVYVEDIESVEADEQHGSRVTLRNGVIIGGLTGAAIVAAVATVRYRRRKKG